MKCFIMIIPAICGKGPSTVVWKVFHVKSDRETTKKKLIKKIEYENHLLDLRDEEIKTFS